MKVVLDRSFLSQQTECTCTYSFKHLHKDDHLAKIVCMRTFVRRKREHLTTTIKQGCDDDPFIK